MYNRSIAADDSCAREREMFLISFIKFLFYNQQRYDFYI
jgi:hypothetical protein